MKGSEGGEKRSKDKRRERQNIEIKTEEGERSPRHGEVAARHFRGARQHKRVIVLAQMLLSHNKQDTMFLLS